MSLRQKDRGDKLERQIERGFLKFFLLVIRVSLAIVVLIVLLRPGLIGLRTK